MEIKDIEKDFLVLKSRLKYTDKKYYHLNSIENFIFNLSLINSESRGFVIQTLNSCFKYYEENSIKDIHHSKEIFNKYLQPIGEVFERQAGFSILIKPWILTVLILIAHFIIYFAHISLIITIICDLFILGFIFNLAIRYRHHKLYAFLW